MSYALVNNAKFDWQCSIGSIGAGKKTGGGGGGGGGGVGGGGGQFYKQCD